MESIRLSTSRRLLLAVLAAPVWLVSFVAIILIVAVAYPVALAVHIYEWPHRRRLRKGGRIIAWDEARARLEAGEQTLVVEFNYKGGPSMGGGWLIEQAADELLACDGVIPFEFPQERDDWASVLDRLSPGASSDALRPYLQQAIYVEKAGTFVCEHSLDRAIVDSRVLMAMCQAEGWRLLDSRKSYDAAA